MEAEAEAEAEADIHPRAPPKRLKTLDKGKEKMEEPELTPSGVISLAAAGMDEEAEDDTCGICLSDSGRSIRGRIDSCDHYFCFVCILEWAKIESRCPLCKRRFRSIRRPPVPGLFPVERVVDVPVRDQVYNPLGNESTSLSDPYAHVSCTICHDSENEELLLLCDLCDSAAHTYCAGLGATVPEGDWYCFDCTISRDSHSKFQLDDDSLPQDTCKDAVVLQVPEQLISISDIVSDEIPSTSSRKPSVRKKKTFQGSQFRNGSRGKTGNSGKKTPRSSLVPTVGEPLGDSVNNIEIGARTLRNCRNLHDHIQSLRSNWNSLRSGPLYFTSSVSSVTIGTSSNTSKQQETTCLVKQEQITSTNMTDTSDIEKAWKMLKIAKAAQSTKRDSRSGDFANSLAEINAMKNPSGYPTKSNDCNIAEKHQPFLDACKGKLPMGFRTSSSRPKDQYFMFNKNQRCNPQNIFRQTPDVAEDTLPPQTFSSQAPRFPGSGETVLDDPHSAACFKNGVSTPPSKKLNNISPSNVVANSKLGIGSKISTSLTLGNNRRKRNLSNEFKSLDNWTEVQNFQGPKRNGPLQPQVLLWKTQLAGSQELLDDPGSAACPWNIVSPPSKNLNSIAPSNVESNTKMGFEGHINSSLALGKQTTVENFQGDNWKGMLPLQIPQLPGYQESLDDPGSAACSRNGGSTPTSRKLSDVTLSDVEANGKMGIGSQINTSSTLRDNKAKGKLSQKSGSVDKLNPNLPGSHVSSTSVKSGCCDNSPKGEIQSLVKLNLRLLNKGIHLETAAFKEVARTSTHSILAACGLEHSKSSARPFPTSICNHSDEIKQLRKSNLLPDSCRECFYTFVRNVVNSVLSEKYLIQTKPD